MGIFTTVGESNRPEDTGANEPPCVYRTRSTLSSIMKTKFLYAPFVMFCAAAALVGCASTERRVSESSVDEKDLQRSDAPSPARYPQPVILDESAFRKLDLNADGAITFDEWQHFDTSAGAKEHFNALDENGDGMIDATEFLKQAPKLSKRYQFFGGTDKADDSYFSWDKDVFQQPGWQLFSIRF